MDSWQDGRKPLNGILSEEDQPGLAGADSPRLRRRYRRSPLNQPQGIRRIGRLRPPPFFAQLQAEQHRRDAYRVVHQSGVPLGCVESLADARALIDAEIPLVRQRLAAAA